MGSGLTRHGSSRKRYVVAAEAPHSPAKHEASSSDGQVADDTSRPRSGSSGGGLAARRKKSGTGLTSLHVKTAGEGFGLHALRNADRRHIRWCSNIAELYKLGQELMPSTHSGMEVRLATQTTSGQEMVIKVRNKSRSFNGTTEEREWRANTEFLLNLPPKEGIARLYAVWEDHQAYYVVMEKVEGQDLFETLKHEGLLPVNDVKQIIRQLLIALAELHSQGLIHKDLKLENVMIERSDVASPSTTGGFSGYESQIHDLANECSAGAGVGHHQDHHQVVLHQEHHHDHHHRHHGVGESFQRALSHQSFGELSTTPTSTPMTVKLIDFDTVEEFAPGSPTKRSQDVLGTDQYIAQEAYDGCYSPASDIFAAGVIAYRLLTNRFPFKRDIFDDKAGENWVGSPKMQEIREKVRTARINWNRNVFDDEPQARDLLQRMLAVSEMDRPSAEAALAHPWLAGFSSMPADAADPLAPTSTVRSSTPQSARKAAWGETAASSGQTPIKPTSPGPTPTSSNSGARKAAWK